MDQAAKGAWTVGRFAATDVKVHWSFALLVAWFIAVGIRLGHDPRSLVEAMVLLVLTCACLIGHEFGHVLAAKAHGIATREVTLMPIGALSRLAGTPATPRADFVIAAAGPAVSAVLTGVFGVAALAVEDQHLGNLREVAYATIWGKLYWANLLILAINMLPALPMDGGKILRAGLTGLLGERLATQVAVVTSYGTVVVFTALAFASDPVFGVMAILVLIYAMGESQRLKASAAARPLQVGDALAPSWVSLHPDELLFPRVDELIAHTQREYPVLRDGQLVGVISRIDLARGLGVGDETVTVATAMRIQVSIALHDEPLHAALARMQAARTRAVPVLMNGRFIGMLLRDDGEQEALNHAAQIAALAAQEAKKKAG
jgi:Zn-dependent protease